MKIYSIGYFLLRELVRIPYRLFYRKINIIGKENIPLDKPLIFAPNHQNALMDPLAMIFSTPKQIVFLARGDIFKGTVLIKILTFLKIMPVYRQHDGKAALRKNEEVFDKSVDYLEHFGAFCLFPESIHNPHRNLRPLKKGIPRIAFMALKKTNFNLDIQIIPTGIYYEDKDCSYSYLQVKYGKPMSLKKYIEQIKENEQKAMSALSKDMEPRIKPLIIDIAENENYEIVEQIRAVYTGRLMQEKGIKPTDKNRFEMDQYLIEQLNGKTLKPELVTNIKNLFALIEKNQWSINTVLKTIPTYLFIVKVLAFILFSPIALQGGFINLLPFSLSKYLRTKLIKDPQFTSSIKFVVGGIIMPIYFLILSLISLIFIEYYWSILVLLLLPVGTYASYYYFKKITEFKKWISYNWSDEKQKVELLKQKIFDDLDALF